MRFPDVVETKHPVTRRPAALWLTALIIALVLPGGAVSNAADRVLPTEPLTTLAAPSPAKAPIQERIAGIEPLSHEVFGYLPYWRLDDETVDNIDYDLVSTISFFGLGIKKTGAIDTDWVGYKRYVGPDAAAVTDAAHAHGVRVVPTFQLFDSKSGNPKMTAFLDSTDAQDRFIDEALDLMTTRLADGASLDFEPNKAVNDRAKKYVAFVARFRAAMLDRFPGSTLTTATSAGANKKVIGGLVPYVDHQVLMTYNYRWSGSTIAGAIAPLDNTERTVKIHVARALQWAPASALLLGVPYYGYDWPVKGKQPNADVRTNNKKYGTVRSVTYRSAREFLAAHPRVKRNYDASEGSGFYTYWDDAHSTHRQVYFEEERSLADKYDYAIVTGLAGVGIWTLENDRGYGDLYEMLREKFYTPVHDVAVRGSIIHVKRASGSVEVRLHGDAMVVGTVPERGALRWTIRDSRDRRIRGGRWSNEILYPADRSGHHSVIRLGSVSGLRAGTYTLRVRFVGKNTTWRAQPVDFHQPY
jgi:spore germination protein YaaH